MPSSNQADERNQLARTLKVLAEPRRLHILQSLATSSYTIGALAEAIGRSQPTVTHHVRLLVDVGLVTSEKQGIWVHVRLVPGALNRVAKALRGVR